MPASHGKLLIRKPEPGIEVEVKVEVADGEPESSPTESVYVPPVPNVIGQSFEEDLREFCGNCCNRGLAIAWLLLGVGSTLFGVGLHLIFDYKNDKNLMHWGIVLACVGFLTLSRGLVLGGENTTPIFPRYCYY